MIDLMFSSKLGYLVVINMNMKYLIVKLMNTDVSEERIVEEKIIWDQFNSKFIKKSKDVNSYLRVLQRIIDSHVDIKWYSISIIEMII